MSENKEVSRDSCRNVNVHTRQHETLLMVRFGVIQALKMLAVDDNILNCKKQLMYSTVKENNKKRVVPSSHKNIRQ